MMPTAAKMQNDFMAGKMEVALTANTTKSVSDVTWGVELDVEGRGSVRVGKC